MQTPMQLTFHGLASSPAFEASARDQLSALERYFDGIVSCRVSLEAAHHHHHAGNVYRVCVELVVPGKRFVAGDAPGDEAERDDAHLALREAFRAVRRQLLDHVHHLRLHGHPAL
jgi:hypothetical protein